MTPAAAPATEGGVCNTRPRPTSGTPTGVLEAGIDTMRALFLVDAFWDQTRAKCAIRHNGGDVAGMRVGFLDGLDLLWAEGRPAELLGMGHALLPAAAVPDAHDALKRRLREHLDVTYLRDEGLSRVDVTATIGMRTPAEGWAVLRGLAALDAPRRKPALYGRPPETVYLLAPTSGAVLERIYDRGVKHLTAAPGLEARFEAQTRYRRDRRHAVGEWTMDRVRDTFRHRFEPLQASADGLRVASEATLRETVRELVASERVTPRQAELLLGHIGCESVGIRRPRSTVHRRRSELRRLGLAQALDGCDDDAVDVPLGDVLSDLLTAGAWNG